MEGISPEKLILDQLDLLQSKSDKLSDQNIEIIKMQAVHTYQLELHMKRTALLEDAVKPLQRTITQAEGALKLIGALSLLLGMIAAIFKIVYH